MGLSALELRVHVELYTWGYYEDYKSAFDMGSQDIHMDLQTFSEIVHSAGIAGYDPGEFARLAEFPEVRIGTRRLYHLLGFETYTCCDIAGDIGGIHNDDLAAEAANGMRWNALKMDLNEPLADPSLEGAFDVVTDFSNNEHVFKTTESYRTMHRLCRMGGLIYISQQMHITNGYYMYDPAYFGGLAEANDYDWVYAGYGVNNYPISIESHIEPLLAPQERVPLIFVFRKTKDAEFRVPDALEPFSQAPPRRHCEITLTRLPETRPMRYLAMTSTDAARIIGGRDAVQALVSRFRPKSRRA